MIHQDRRNQPNSLLRITIPIRREKPDEIDEGYFIAHKNNTMTWNPAIEIRSSENNHVGGTMTGSWEWERGNLELLAELVYTANSTCHKFVEKQKLSHSR